MPREFELRKEIAIDATPEQVWDAIATGQGITSWFMPHEVQPGPGGTVTLKVEGFTEEAAITAWDPPHRLEYRTDSEQPWATEYLIEGRDGGSTVMRFVQHGFLGDDWETEYEAMGMGWDMYFHTLAQYVKYFPGQGGAYVLAEGPQPSAEEANWSRLFDRLGVTDSTAVGDRIQFTVDGLAPVDAVVDYILPSFVGLRSNDALYRFHGRCALGMVAAVGHHMFSEVDTKEHSQAWKSWLDQTFA